MRGLDIGKWFTRRWYQYLFEPADDSGYTTWWRRRRPKSWRDLLRSEFVQIVSAGCLNIFWI